MKEMKIITLKNEDKWDEIVKSFSKHDVYHLSGYTKAFQSHGDGEPILFFYEDNYYKAMNVVMKRDVAKDQSLAGKLRPDVLFDLATPYGYGGFILEGFATEEDLKILDMKYIKLCRAEGMVSEFVRFHPVEDNATKISPLYDVSKLGKTVTMKLESKGHIWNDLTSKNRNAVRKAKKAGVEICTGRDPELFEMFMDMYNRTMDTFGAKDYYYFKKDFYDSILTDLEQNSLVFYAVYGGKIISMSIVLFSNNQMHYHLSASDRDYHGLSANNLLLYRAACWGCEKGYRTFHLGGGLNSREDSLYKFKKAFNRNTNTHFSVGRKIFNKEKYRELVDLREESESFNLETDFFPKYRARI